ncbi:redoxin domain-containing protein [bacterium]|nr:redoxin domain-containing protein [bacterium]
MPSIQQQIWNELKNEDFSIVCFFNQTDLTTLKQYLGMNGITYTAVLDQASDYFNLYKAGIQHSTLPPVYLLIDREGIIRYRYESVFGAYAEIKTHIEELLGGS